MIEELKDEELVKKVGGRFRLTTLIQKRLAVLNRGSQAYVDTTGESDNLQIVVREIMENKIQLREDGELVGGDGEPLDFSTVIQ